MELSYTLKSSDATRALGKLFGNEIRSVARGKKHALCLALSGELGAGKTFFTQNVAQGLGVRGRLQSPTFVIAKRYALRGSTFKNFWHFDLTASSPQKNLIQLDLSK